MDTEDVLQFPTIVRSDVPFVYNILSASQSQYTRQIEPIRRPRREPTGEPVIYLRTSEDLIEIMNNGNYISNIDSKNDMISELKYKTGSEATRDLRIGNTIGFECNDKNCQFVSRWRRTVASHVISEHNKVCRICNKEFRKWKTYQFHMNYKHKKRDEPKLKCPFPDCSYETFWKSALSNHSSKHTDERAFVCTVDDCPKAFKTKSGLKLHLQTGHSDEKPFACDWPACNSRFKTRGLALTHKRTHLGTRKNMTRLRQTLKDGNYISTVDPKNKKISVIRGQTISDNKIKIGETMGFKCNHTDCQYITYESMRIRQHMTTHTNVKMFFCDKCPKSFHYSHKLRAHKRCVHNSSSLPVLKCAFPGCQYQTFLPQTLDVHRISHGEERPFPCDEDGCGKTYKTNSALNYHKTVSHSNARPVPCEHAGCLRSFKTSKHLTLHERKVHSNSKPFSCDFPKCGMQLRSETALLNHKKTHKYAKQFDCRYKGCGKAFTTKFRLNEHIRKHRGFRFLCTVGDCDKSYAHLDTYQKHMQSHQ